MQKINKYLKSVLKFSHNVYLVCEKMDIIGLSSEIAFNFIFSLFPLIISLVGLLGLFSRDAQVFLDITSFIYASFPENLAEFLKQNLLLLSSNPFSWSAFIIGFILCIYTSSNVVTSFIKGINRAYEIEEKRNFFKVRLISIYLILEISILLLFAFFLIVYGQSFFNLILNLNYSIFPQDIGLRLNILRWLSVSLVLFLVSSSLYYKSLNIKQRLFEVVPGAVVFAVSWIILTMLLGVYLRNFAHLDITYGTLGIMLSLLIWLFITAFTLLLGAAINSIIFKTETNIFKKIKEKIVSFRIL